MNISMNITKVGLEQALAQERQQPYFPVFSQKYGHDVLAQDRLAARLATLPAEFDVRAILPPLDTEAPDYPDWVNQVLWVAKLAFGAAVAAGYVPPEVRIEGDYCPAIEGEDYSALTIICGNLTVTGNLLTTANLVVLGHMHVHGAWVDTYMDVACSTVAGNLTVGKSLLSEGGLGVGGRLTAPYVSLQYNQGYATVLGGCTATLLVESDHGGSQIYGDSAIEYLIFDELRLLPPQKANGGELLTHLAELFQPAFVAAFAPRYEALRQIEEAGGDPDYDDQLDEFYDDFYEALHQGFCLKDAAVFRHS